VSSPYNDVVRPAYLSRRQTAEYLGITTKTVDRWIASGRLDAVRIGPRLLRIPVASIEALLTEAV
jgi:excisionase family DNA binding protein